MDPSPTGGHRTRPRAAIAALAALLAALAPGAAQALEPWSDLREAASIFFSDLAFIATAPARMDGGDALQLGAVAASTGALYAADESVYGMFRRNRDRNPFDPWREAADLIEPAGHMGKTNPYVMGTLLVSYIAGLDRVAIASAQILQSQATAGIGKDIALELVGRQRPYEGQGPYAYGAGGSSFPSGHASNIVQAAVIVSHHSPWKAVDVTVWAAAITISLQRITSAGHWPSDVWLSGIYGYAVSSALMRRYEERRQGTTAAAPPPAEARQSWTSRLRWTPIMGEGQVGAMVEVGF